MKPIKPIKLEKFFEPKISSNRKDSTIKVQFGPFDVLIKVEDKHNWDFACGAIHQKFPQGKIKY